jgi:hypothetical protein
VLAFMLSSLNNREARYMTVRVHQCPSVDILRERRTELRLLPAEAIPVVHRQSGERPLRIAPPLPILVGSLPDDRLRLVEPIQAELKEEGSFFIAEARRFHEFGYGHDPFSAVDDLRDTICELFWSLSGDEVRLGSDLANVLAALREAVETS